MSFSRSIYGHSPILVQNLFVSLYGAQLHRLRYGGAYQDYSREVERTQWLDHSSLKAVQYQRLKKLLLHAYENCGYYRKAFHSSGFQPERMLDIDDLEVLRPIDRTDIFHNLDEMISADCGRRRLITHYTSGTTGSPLRLTMDRNTFWRSYAFWTRFRRWFGWNMGKRRATFGGRIIIPNHQKKPPYWRTNLVENQLVMSSFHISRETIRDYAKRLRRFDPFVIEGYVSSIYMLAKFAIEEQVELPKPAAVQTTSETLLSHQRDLIERAFACKVYDQYGHGEAAVFVSECEKGSLHVSDEYGVVEVLAGEDPAKPGEIGEIVVTGLNNWAMPLIRYRTGDLAVRETEDFKCECGRGLSVLRSIEGRVLDVLHLPSGRIVPPTALTLLFDRAHALGITEARVRQVSARHLVVDTVYTGTEFEKVASGLESELRLIVGEEVRVQAHQVEEIERPKSGKYKFVVNEINTH